jgi:hypothetical protein
MGPQRIKDVYCTPGQLHYVAMGLSRQRVRNSDGGEDFIDSTHITREPTITDRYQGFYAAVVLLHGALDYHIVDGSEPLRKSVVLSHLRRSKEAIMTLQYYSVTHRPYNAD